MLPELSIPRFAPEVEREFQTSYYVRVRPTLRLVSGVLAITLAAYLWFGLYHTVPFISVFNTPYLVFCLLLYGLTYMPWFGKVWQSATVGLACVASAVMLFWMASSLIATPSQQTDAEAAGIILHLFFLLQTCVLMVGLAALRLPFRPTIVLQSGVAAVGICVVMFVLSPGANSLDAGVRFAEPVLLILLGVALAAFIQEQLSRGAFEANRNSLLLQAQEHRMRVESEKMLHVLNGAIGGIVHDLGNPLTNVQVGSELVDNLLRDNTIDKETLLKLNDTVRSGAQMLNFLRLSLIEQSRVLEGKAVPVELKPVSVQTVVEVGTRFQKPRFSHGHTLSFEEQDFTINADEMKMVTVLMNLIGNALKYSDGQVRIAWKRYEDMLLLAVLDEGQAGYGLTPEQAARLFTPFGRLETHAGIEGTGLGLLSVQKIVEAHGGEVWIEGLQNGTHESGHFSTTGGNYPTMLCAPFRTAFALTCPLAE
ncbi:HAMP domain-containing histidine kinase [bacterium]|nr:MAG: HAMP domain-containing histidine kinase [bacterium]